MTILDQTDFHLLEREITEMMSPYFFRMLKSNVESEEEFRYLILQIHKGDLVKERVFINGLRSLALQLEQKISTPSSVRDWIEKQVAAK